MNGRVGLVGAAALVVGCSDPAGGRGAAGTYGPLTGAAMETEGSDAADTDPPDGDDLQFDLGSDDSGPGAAPGTGECAAISDTAMVGLQPADIIFVVDNSGSMQFEASAVQANLNAFSSQIFLANIDAHVVLLSAYPSSGQGICIDPPLGMGGCPTADDKPPDFTHLDVGIGSNDGLMHLLSQFPNYAPVLRPTASRHVVMVTDDDSDLSAGQFSGMWVALDPNNAGYKFHGIVSDRDPISACLQGHVCCALSADEGSEYKTLINQTGGVFGDLCSQQFQPIFDAVAQQVIGGATLACEYEIPTPPDGMDFDKDEVNVEFDAGGGQPLAIGRVDDPAQCAMVSQGWYYDDPANPQRIIVCPQTCETIQGFETASVSISFGCATVPAG